MLIKDIVKELSKLESEYDRLRYVISDDFKDNFIDLAIEKINKLLEIKEKINSLENIEVKEV